MLVSELSGTPWPVSFSPHLSPSSVEPFQTGTDPVWIKDNMITDRETEAGRAWNSLEVTLQVTVLRSVPGLSGPSTSSSHHTKVPPEHFLRVTQMCSPREGAAFQTGRSALRAALGGGQEPAQTLP